LILRSEAVQSELEALVAGSPGLVAGDCLSCTGPNGSGDVLFKVERVPGARDAAAAVAAVTVAVEILPGLAGVEQPAAKVLLAAVAGGSADWAEICRHVKGDYPRHVAVGDLVEFRSEAADAQQRIFVVDVEPDGGGLVGADTTFFLSPTALPVLSKARIVRASDERQPVSEAACDALRRRLRRDAGRLLLAKDLIVAVDDERGAHRRWQVAALDDGATARGVFAASTLVAVGDAHAHEPSRCLACDVDLEPPGANYGGLVFACPLCGRAVVNGAAPLWAELRASAPGPGRDLLLRVRVALGQMAGREDGERVDMLTQILSRLPRDIYGRLDFIVLNEIARRVDLMAHRPLETARGVRADLLARLPTCAYRTGMSDVRCDICLADFAADAQLRILPCLHKFHVGCIDAWLSVSTACPLCKHAVIVGTDADE